LQLNDVEHVTLYKCQVTGANSFETPCVYLCLARAIKFGTVVKLWEGQVLGSTIRLQLEVMQPCGPVFSYPLLHGPTTLIRCIKFVNNIMGRRSWSLLLLLTLS